MTSQTFKDGEIIFHEGDTSLAMFVVLKGKVRLTKMGPNGSVTLATLTKGEMFGEMGILDGVSRSTSAVADGTVTVEITARHDFLDRLQREPDLAIKVMSKLVERLRAADEKLVQQLPVEMSSQEPEQRSNEVLNISDTGSGKTGLLGRLFSFSKQGDKPETKSVLSKPSSGPIRIVVANFGSNLPPPARETLGAITDTLGMIPQAIVKRADIEVDWPDDMMTPEAARQLAARNATRLLTARGIDILVWGRVDTISHLLEVHATVADTHHEIRLGRIPPAAAVYVPLEESSPCMLSLLRAQAMAAFIAESNRRTSELLSALRTDVMMSAPELQKITSGYAAAEQAGMYLVWANAASLCLGLDGETPEMWEQVVKAFENAARRLPRQARDDWADLYIGLSLVDYLRAERGLITAKPDGTVWDSALETIKLAVENIKMDDRPWDWAFLQERLGNVCYRLASITGDDKQFKESLNAYQAATQVYTRAEYPLKWAEVVSALSQVLQVYGDMLGSIPALERAVELLRATLEVRSEEEMPQLWAASQNNVGSALFLLAKRQDSSKLYGESADAFRKALSFYQVHGHEKQAAVTEKNLARAEDACDTRNRRNERLAQPKWSQDQDT